MNKYFDYFWNIFSQYFLWFKIIFVRVYDLCIRMCIIITVTGLHLRIENGVSRHSFRLLLSLQIVSWHFWDNSTWLCAWKYYFLKPNSFLVRIRVFFAPFLGYLRVQMIFGASSLGQWSHNVTQPFRLNNHNVGRGWVTGMGLIL